MLGRGRPSLAPWSVPRARVLTGQRAGADVGRWATGPPMRISYMLAFAAAIAVAACGNGNPLAKIRVRADAVVWQATSEDGKVKAYLLKDFQGGATGDAIYDLVVGEVGSQDTLRIMRCDLDGPPTSIQTAWVGNTLHIRYTHATIWEFSNGFPYGNGDSAKTYEVVLEKR